MDLRMGAHRGIVHRQPAINAQFQMEWRALPCGTRRVAVAGTHCEQGLAVHENTATLAQLLDSIR